MRSETWIQRGFLACAMSIVASTVPAYASDNCVLTQVAKLPLSVSADGTVTVPMTIGGRVLTMAVDTGGTVSALTEPAVAQLRLTPHNYNLRIWHSFDSENIDRFVVADNVELGGLKANSMEFGYLPAGRMPTGLDGAVGPSMLKNYDVEFDFANSVLSLYSRNHCPGQFSHWTDGEYAKIDFTSDQFGMIELPVELDGKEFLGLVHTGYTNSRIALDFVTFKFGIDENDPNLVKRPGGNQYVRYYSYRFKTLKIQGITINNPQLELASYTGGVTLMKGEHPLVLGMDILRRLHLYIAYGDHVIYVTPATAH